MLCCFHSELFIESDSIIVSAEIQHDIFFAACNVVRHFDESRAYSLAAMLANYAQIGEGQPVSEIGYAKANTDKFSAWRSCCQADRGVFQQSFYPFLKSLFWILRAKV